MQMGLGRKIDPEPGRCRRTDGKKWRCSKEAYPDSKYCERHMHRGKNRSRKPVEVVKTSASAITIASTSPSMSSSITRNNSPPPSLSPTGHSLLTPLSNSSSSSSSSLSSSHQLQNCILYHQTPPSRPTGYGFSLQDNTNSSALFLDNNGSPYSQNNTDYRYFSQKQTFSCVCGVSRCKNW